MFGRSEGGWGFDFGGYVDFKMNGSLECGVRSVNSFILCCGRFKGGVECSFVLKVVI